MSERTALLPFHLLLGSCCLRGLPLKMLLGIETQLVSTCLTGGMLALAPMLSPHPLESIQPSLFPTCVLCSQQQWQQLQTEPAGKDIKEGRGQLHESHGHCPLHCAANLWLHRAQETLDKHQPPCNVSTYVDGSWVHILPLQIYPKYLR